MQRVAMLAVAMVLMVAGLIWMTRPGPADPLIMTIAPPQEPPVRVDAAPAVTPAQPVCPPCAAEPKSAKTEPTPEDFAVREARRLDRYDRNNDGSVDRAEYLRDRVRAYERLDTNNDGVLSFEEYAVKTIARFDKADGNDDDLLDAEEFLATRTR